MDLLGINSRQTYKEFYETMITNGLGASITLPTCFTEKIYTLIDNIFHNCIYDNQFIKCGGALLTDLSDTMFHFI